MLKCILNDNPLKQTSGFNLDLTEFTLGDSLNNIDLLKSETASEAWILNLNSMERTFVVSTAPQS